MMLKYILPAIIAIAGLAPTAVHAQGPAPAAAPKEKAGLRFVLINDVPVKTVYIPTSEKSYKKIELRPGLPGERVAYPESGRIDFYTEPPKQGPAAPKPLLSAPLPVQRGAKLLGLVGSSNNQIYIIFVDESPLKYGTVLFKNMTNKDYLVDMPTAPTGEPQRFLLKGSTDHLFGKDSPAPARTKTYQAIMRHQVRIKEGEEPKWFVERKFMVTSYGRRSMVCLILPNPAGTEMEMQQIILFPESNQSGEENARPPAPPR